ncbi:expressed unknown protein [Seminavis robusta]|uniref:Uncharacterized protein n=1 Tax=Seminavis robusta TaxID=568900 RepID=A0A9N8DE11_9STRA|nr:expressed unknown protein [Seminavis robusta]|eukprot:Sro29_g019020.1 n/a (223) ;mRNA; f:37968-38831
MPRGLRRSRRVVSGSKKTSNYHVNDIVEIVRGNATVKARLAQLLSDPSSDDPLWLVRFDGLSLKDEEIHEHVFAKPPPSLHSDNSLSDRDSYGRRRSGYGSDSNHHRNHYDDVEDYSRNRAKRALAKDREARSKRRQAKIDETARQSPPPPNNKRRIPPPPRYKGKRSRYHGKTNHSSNGNNSNGSSTTGDDEEEVVTVKLLTGTLYLHKGLNRRAEFHRRV